MAQWGQPADEGNLLFHEMRMQLHNQGAHASRPPTWLPESTKVYSTPKRQMSDLVRQVDPVIVSSFPCLKPSFLHLATLQHRNRSVRLVAELEYPNKCGLSGRSLLQQGQSSEKSGQSQGTGQKEQISITNSCWNPVNHHISLSLSRFC
jgi:hypothetical protein